MTVQIHQSIFVDDELVKKSPGFKGDMENGKSLKLGAAKQNTREKKKTAASPKNHRKLERKIIWTKLPVVWLPPSTR